MTSAEIVKRLEPWLTKHSRPAWKPIVQEGDGQPTDSKFCGTPWIGPDAPWPECGRCGKPLPLFLPLDLGDNFDAGTLRLECPELGLDLMNRMNDCSAEDIAISQPGDKLAGWPAWVQNVEYPHCPRCGGRRVHVFQMDSEDNIPFMFGDVGCGHITQCSEHKEIVAFGWACS